MLSVSLLGAPTLALDGRPLPLARRKSRAILYYLAAHSKPLTREHLLGYFWPDLDRPAAQQTLRTTLHGLRKTLGPSFIVEDDTLALAPDTQVDVRAFESNIQLPREASNLQLLTSTLSLYRGDFLEGFSLPNTPAFDDWAAAERERFRRLAVRGLAALSQLHESGGRFAAALEALERALAFDSLQEDLQRAAMRLHYLAGDRAAAIRRYDSLRKLLDEEMGVPPMAETRAVYDSIINDKLADSGRRPAAAAGRAPPTRNYPPSTIHFLPFTGRETELQTLRGLAASNRLILIEGEPGIGKTRLAEEHICDSKAVPLIGAAHELEQPLPYQPVIEALRGLLGRTDWPALFASIRQRLSPVWLAETARLLPELAITPSTPSADESRLWEGLHQFLLTLAEQQPVILFIDDIQWADASTLALLGYLTRRGQPAAPIAYLAAARPAGPRSPLASLLQTLTRENRLSRLPLRRLTRDNIAAIARSLSPTYAEPLAEWLARIAEGNPYVLAEVVRFAHESNLIRSDGQVNLTALSQSPLLPQTIYSLIQSRLARLSDPARRVLDAAVAAGRTFEFDIVYHAAGLSEAAAVDALDELRAAGLVHPEPGDSTGRLHTFDHTLTMEVAYREVGEARHRLLHRRVAEAIESIYGRRRIESVAGIIASHYHEGGDPDRAAPYAIRAGGQAARLAAWKEAIEFFEMALAGDPDNDRRRDVYMELGEARFRAGEAAQSSEAFRAALALSAPGTVDSETARISLARSFLTQARFAETIEQAKQIRPVTPSIAAQAEFVWGTALSIEGADLAAAAEHLHKGEALLNQSGASADLPWLSQIKFELGSVAAQLGSIEDAVALYREALDIAEESPADSAIAQRILAHNNIGYHLHLLGDPSAAEHARAGLALAREQGILLLQPFLLSTLGEIALAAGDLDAAEQSFDEGLALAERLSIPERIAGLTANLGLAARARGQTDLAIHRLSTALARADSLGTRHLAAQIRLWLAPLLPPAEARACLAEAHAIAESSGRKRLLEEVMRLERLSE